MVRRPTGTGAEARLRALADSIPHLVWSSAPHGRWLWCNLRWSEYTGVAEPATHDLGWLRSVHPDDREPTMAAWRAAIGLGELRIEHRLRAADGSYRWFDTRALPQRDGGAAASEWFGTSTDIDDRHAAETRLRASEARLRDFAEALDDAMWIYDAAHRRFVYLSPAFERIWGLPRRAIMDDPARWAATLHPDDRARVLAYLPATLAGARHDVEYRILRPADGALRWIRDTGFAVPDGAAGLARDITAMKEAEERQRVLTGELNHRVKNALASAQSLASQTARSVAESGSDRFLGAFTSRLLAFARAHDLLTRDAWRGAAMADLVRETLRPHEGDPVRISASGPPLRLVPDAALALHLALHELATNAAKHGALSVPEGRVDLAWWFEPPDDRAVADGALLLHWRERQGPPVPGPPERRGFGSRLVERGVAGQLGGQARLEFPPEGVEWHLRLPLSARIQAPADD